MKEILKNILSSTFRIILWISILSLLLLATILFIWWTPWKSSSLTERYITIWDYSIWKQQYYYNICNKKSGCFNWELLWLKQSWNSLYLFIKANYSTFWTTDDTTWTFNIEWYHYNLFKEYEIKSYYNKNEIPKYWYLSWNNLEFYSENDLEKLSKEKQDIFKKLEKNPTIIINWVDYSKN